MGNNQAPLINVLENYYHRIIRKIDNRINHFPTNDLPRKVTIRNFILSGVRFEVSTPVEVYRVEEYGNEEKFIRLILSDIKPNDVFFDIGACIGFLTIHAYKKGAKVVAFEPDQRHRNRLQNNLYLNNISNVSVISWAVSDKFGQIELYSDGLDSSSPGFIPMERRNSTIVNTDTIDSALKRNEIPYPDLIKIDIEGAEFLAIMGMKNLIEGDRPPRNIYIEIHPNQLNFMGSSPEEVIGHLAENGYQVVYTNQRENEIHFKFAKQ